MVIEAGHEARYALTVTLLLVRNHQIHKAYQRVHYVISLLSYL
jgi:hypothetical protein